MRGGLEGCVEDEGSHYQLLGTRVNVREKIVLIDPVITAYQCNLCNLLSRIDFSRQDNMHLFSSYCCQPLLNLALLNPTTIQTLNVSI